MCNYCFLCIKCSLFFLPSQVARAGRFGTKGLAITFVSDETDAKTLNEVQDRFEVNVAELPEEIDISSYSKFLFLTVLKNNICSDCNNFLPQLMDPHLSSFLCAVEQSR